MDLAILLDKYGLPAVLTLLLLFNIKNIAAFVERLLSRIWPTFAEQQRLKLERITTADERIDTVLVLKDMLLAYRQELDDSKMERRQLHNRLLELVGLYHKRDAQMVEALRDISEVLRSQTRRLDEITTMMRIQNSYGKNTSHDKERR